MASGENCSSLWTTAVSNSLREWTAVPTCEKAIKKLSIQEEKTLSFVPLHPLHHNPDEKRENSGVAILKLMEQEKDPYSLISHSLAIWQSSQQQTSSTSIDDEKQSKGHCITKPIGKQSRNDAKIQRCSNKRVQSKTYDLNRQHRNYQSKPRDQSKQYPDNLLTNGRKAQFMNNRVKQYQLDDKIIQYEQQNMKPVSSKSVHRQQYWTNQPTQSKTNLEFMTKHSSQPKFECHDKVSNDIKKGNRRVSFCSDRFKQDTGQRTAQHDIKEGQIAEKKHQKVQGNLSDSCKNSSSKGPHKHHKKTSGKAKLTDSEWERIISSAGRFKVNCVSLPINAFDGAGVNLWPEENNADLKQFARRSVLPINAFDGAGVNPWPEENVIDVVSVHPWPENAMNDDGKNLRPEQYVLDGASNIPRSEKLPDILATKFQHQTIEVSDDIKVRSSKERQLLDDVHQKNSNTVSQKSVDKNSHFLTPMENANFPKDKSCHLVPVITEELTVINKYKQALCKSQHDINTRDTRGKHKKWNCISSNAMQRLAK